MKNFGLQATRGFCSHVRTRLGSIPPATAIHPPSRNANDTGRNTDHRIPTEITYGLPLDEDLKAGAISKTIRNQWSNIPQQVRRTIEESRSTSSNASSVLSDGPVNPLLAQVNNVLALLGKGPADLELHRKDYCSSLALVPYKKGMKAAYHWPRVLIPRSVAARCREDLRVDPIDADKPILLLDQVLDKTSIVFCFSGNELSGLSTGVRAWKEIFGETSAQTLHIHMCEGWLSRHTHPLTRQLLRSFRDEEIEPSKRDKLYIYRGKLSRDIVLDFHLYNKSLPSVLLVDQRGYIRWHAVGLPTDESAALAANLLKQLVREKM